MAVVGAAVVATNVPGVHEEAAMRNKPSGSAANDCALQRRI